jgi:hypothetical protein
MYFVIVWRRFSPILIPLFKLPRQSKGARKFASEKQSYILVYGHNFSNIQILTVFLQTVDSRQHCFLLQSAGHEPRYLSVETRQELLRIENSWNCSVVNSVIKLGRKTFPVSHYGKGAGLTLDWNSGFSLTEGTDPNIIWNYKFSQLRGSRFENFR